MDVIHRMDYEQTSSQFFMAVLDDYVGGSALIDCFPSTIWYFLSDRARIGLSL